MAKKPDILTEKQQRLDLAVQRYDSAVAVVTNTISSLSALSQDIAQQIADIDTYVASLNDTRAELELARNRTNKVSQNFAQLLCIADEDAEKVEAG